MGNSVGRDALVRVQGGGRYIDTRTNKSRILALAPFELIVLASY